MEEEDVNEAVKTQDSKTSSQTGKGSFDSHTGKSRLGWLCGATSCAYWSTCTSFKFAPMIKLQP